MTPVPTSTLLVYADARWRGLTEVIDGLTAEEMFWEPADGCWTIRRQSDGSMANDWTPDPPQPPPLTTIAWRLNHIGYSLGAHSRRLFGEGSFDFQTHRYPDDVAGTVVFVTSSFESWRRGISGLGETVEEPLALEILSLTTHVAHHGAEIGVLRDVYRAERPLSDEPFVDAALRRRVCPIALHERREAVATSRHSCDLGSHFEALVRRRRDANVYLVDPRGSLV